MEMKHTPGPWGWFGSPTSGFYLATRHSGRRYVMEFVRMGFNSAQPRFQVKGEGMIDGKDHCIFEVARDVVGIEAAKKPGSGVYRKDIVGFAHADARLIAAAPDLLEALQGLLTAYEDPGNTGSTHDDKVLAARNAIAKATE